MNIEWLDLNRYELGQFAKRYAKEKFSEMGLEISDVPNNSDSIDFVVRGKSGIKYRINVRSLSRPGTGYCFIEKDRFNVDDEDLLLVLILFYELTAEFYVIPAKEWKHENRLLRNRDYIGLKSKPEWGINISQRNMDILKKYDIKKFKEFLL